MISHRLAVLFFLSLVAGPGSGPAALAQGESEEQDRVMDAVHCLRVNDIDDIDVVDSDTLVFRMRGGAVYQNELPHRCPGLRSNSTLMYRSSVGRLCSVDIVTVLENWGFGFAPGASCGLGMFQPITDQIADELLRSSED